MHGTQPDPRRHASAEAYERPMVVVIGTVKELTKGSSGDIGDAAIKKSHP